MSVRYLPVSWTRSKLVYDAVLVAAVVVFLIGFDQMAERAGLATAPTDEGSLPIRAFGLCALLLLNVALALGPLARLDTRFLPLLYNRRHLGVVTFAVAAAHVFATFDWYLAFSPVDPWVALLASDAAFGQPRNFPFVPFGLAAFLILGLLAATSHDFWLKFLGPGLWKSLHMGVYAAYTLVVAHVAFGALQSAQSWALPLVLVGGAAALIALHVAAALRERSIAQGAGRTVAPDGWVRAGDAKDIPDGRALVVRIAGGDEVAIFNDGGQFSAIGHRCAHQNGPLGEGRVIDGRVVCPWHGYEYDLRDGCAPAPFTERVPTYPLRVENGVVFVHGLADPAPRREPVKEKS
jgi:nitrite reductase/ring-hydroxylating ferredoxin subunit/DMSO/TMAO reductase YedYZ heme-binding membrane subunit